jgi:hypothetical protein
MLVLPAAADAASQWRTPITISGAGAFSPQIDVDPTGTAIAVWLQADSGFNRVYSAVRPKGGSFGTATPVSAASQNALEPKVAVDSNGNAVVAWVQDNVSPAFDRILAAYRPVGGSFTVSPAVSNDGANAFNPDVDFDADGNAILVWARGLNIESAFRPVGGSFGPTTTLSTNTGSAYAYEPKVAGEDGGNAVAAWTRFDGTNLLVQVAERKLPVYPEPASASSMSVALVPIFKPCGITPPPPGSHAPPFGGGTCVAAVSGVAHVGAANVSSATITVIPGNFTTVANEADVRYQVSATDIRSTSPTGPEYNPVAGGPDMTLDARIRITDSNNGATATDPATAVELGFPIPVDCVTTGGPDGSNCTADTTANAVSPGSVKEGKDEIIQTFRILLEDAGPDNIRGNSDDKFMEQQGYFVP